MREKIEALEKELMAMPGSRKDYPVFHHFSPGVYLREVRIPKGDVVVGKIHKTEHLNILSQGRLAVWTEEGMKILNASCVIPSKPGAKRVGYALEDSVWICVHWNPDDQRDLVVLEDRYTCESFEQFEEFSRKELSWRG